MNESACQFGDLQQLSGVVVELGGTRCTHGLVLVSAGLVPKFGPYGIYAALARRLAADGVVVMRFDLGGIGESRQAYVGMTLRERTAVEIGAAVDYLIERYQLQTVIVGGICSGAEDGFRYASTDARVSGVVMVDPFTYRMSGWRWRHLLHQGYKALLWLLGIYRPLRYSGSPAVDGTAVDYKYMERDEAGGILRMLLQRACRIHVFYTSGVRATFNHVHQFRKMFPELQLEPHVSVDYLPHLEHTQKILSDQRNMIEAISRRLLAHVGVRRAGS